MANNVSELVLDKDVVVPSGKLLFAKRDPDTGELGGFIDFGIIQEFPLTGSGETLELKDTRSPSREVVASRTTSLARSGNFTTYNMTPENRKLFFAGELETENQQASAVADKAVGKLEENGIYYPGMDHDGDGVVLGASSISVAAVPAYPAAWVASTSYSKGDFRIPTVANGRLYRALNSGESGASEPTWPTTVGDKVTDGSGDNQIEWQCVNDTSVTLVDGTDYEIDDTDLTGLRIKWLRAATDVGYAFMAYTPTALSIEVLKTTGKIDNNGALILEATSTGHLEIWIMPNVTLTPDGDFNQINDGTEWQTMSFLVDVKPQGSVPAITVRKRPNSES